MKSEPTAATWDESRSTGTEAKGNQGRGTDVGKRSRSASKEETREARKTAFPGGAKMTGMRSTNEIEKYSVSNPGRSHQIKHPIPEREVSASILQAGTVSIFGISSFRVNQTAAEIYRFKKPEPYKGKGIRYDGEKSFEKTRKG